MGQAIDTSSISHCRNTGRQHGQNRLGRLHCTQSFCVQIIEPQLPVLHYWVHHSGVSALLQGVALPATAAWLRTQSCGKYSSVLSEKLIVSGECSQTAEDKCHLYSLQKTLRREEGEGVTTNACHYGNKKLVTDCISAGKPLTMSLNPHRYPAGSSRPHYDTAMPFYALFNTQDFWLLALLVCGMFVFLSMLPMMKVDQNASPRNMFSFIADALQRTETVHEIWGRDERRRQQASAESVRPRTQSRQRPPNRSRSRSQVANQWYAPKEGDFYGYDMRQLDNHQQQTGRSQSRQRSCSCERPATKSDKFSASCPRLYDDRHVLEQRQRSEYGSAVRGPLRTKVDPKKGGCCPTPAMVPYGERRDVYGRLPKQIPGEQRAYPHIASAPSLNRWQSEIRHRPGWTSVRN